MVAVKKGYILRKNGFNTNIFGFSTKNFSRFLRKTYDKMLFKHKKIAVIPQKFNVLAQICGIT